MNIINLVLGVVLLTTGKKLYWLFVAIIGFVIGLGIATQYVQLNPPWMIYIVALGVGVIGAILATFLQHLAIALAGFVVGGYGAQYIAGLLGINTEVNTWMALSSVASLGCCWWQACLTGRFTCFLAGQAQPWSPKGSVCKGQLAWWCSLPCSCLE